MKKKDFNRLHVDLQKKTFSWLAIGAKHQENVAIVHAFDVVLEPPSLTSRQYLRCLENYDEATIEEVKRIPTKPGKKPYIEELLCENRQRHHRRTVGKSTFGKWLPKSAFQPKERRPFLSLGR